jgi:hypothetical protein
VLVPVITKISFIDPVKQYQEYQYTVDNSSGSDRDVHIDTVTSSAGSGTLDVERIDVWKVIDAIKQYQESQFKFDNVTGAHDTPIHFTTHAKTHKVKWGDSSAWVQSELIDRFSIIDPVQQYQEHEFTLTGNPDADANGFAVTQADFGDADITDSGSIDPPWRTDPFQNIVDFNDSGGNYYPVPRCVGSYGAFITPDGMTLQTNNSNTLLTLYTQTPGNVTLNGSQSGFPAGVPLTITGDKFIQHWSWSGTTLMATIANHTGDTQECSIDFSGISFTCSDDMPGYPGNLAYPGITWVQYRFNSPPSYPDNYSVPTAISILYQPTGLHDIEYPPDTTSSNIIPMVDKGEQGYLLTFG